MALTTWNTSLSVKVQHFDDQHKQLVNYINELHDAMVSGNGAEVIGKVLDSLVEYTATHFSEEEQLMEVYAYPDTATHKHEHELLVKQVLDMQQKFAAGENILTISVMMYLQSWLMNHIQIVDKKYGNFFNMHGVK